MVGETSAWPLTAGCGAALQRPPGDPRSHSLRSSQTWAGTVEAAPRRPGEAQGRLAVGLDRAGEAVFSLATLHSFSLFPLQMGCGIKSESCKEHFDLTCILKIESRLLVAVLMEWFSTESCNIFKNDCIV